MPTVIFTDSYRQQMPWGEIGRYDEKLSLEQKGAELQGGELKVKLELTRTSESYQLQTGVAAVTFYYGNEDIATSSELNPATQGQGISTSTATIYIKRDYIDKDIYIKWNYGFGDKTSNKFKINELDGFYWFSSLSVVEDSHVNYTINRTNCPSGFGSKGELTNGAILYGSDSLKITFNPTATSYEAKGTIETTSANPVGLKSGDTISIPNNNNLISPVNVKFESSLRATVSLWNGTAWKKYSVYLYKDSTNKWKQYQAYVWTGSTWKQCY